MGRPRKNLPIEEGVTPEFTGLTYEEQIFVCSHIAIHTPLSELAELMRTKFNKTISLSMHRYYISAPAWQPKIQKFREEFEAKVTDEPLSSKRVRVRELSRTYAKLRDGGELRDSVVVLNCIRDEVEGKSSGGTNITQYNQYNNLSDDELRKVIAENNRFLEIHTKRQEQIQIELKPEEQQ